MPNTSSSVRPIHFEDFDGFEFERLVFAYHWRTEEWRSLEWYGQTGSDLGRDIWGVRENATKDGESVCIQCVNRKSLKFAKVAEDIAKVLAAPNGAPYRFRIVAQSRISAQLRDKIKAHVTSLGVQECDIWSGSEFEEFLRKNAEFLLKRFVEGESFPDAPDDLRKLATALRPLNDREILEAFAKLFDRPAFYTPIYVESNLGDFKQAITDTIQALSTGIWKARDGHVIGRIASRHELKDADLRAKIQAVEKALSRLRARYDEMVRSGVLRHAANSHYHFFRSPEDADVLEHLRREVLMAFRSAYPPFHLPSW